MGIDWDGISYKAVLPRAFTGEKWQRLYLLDAVKAQARETRRQFQGTTKHWKSHSVKFDWKRHFSKNELSFEITMEGDEQDIDVWHYLDKGTETRYVVMEEDFLSKTLVKDWRTREGRGGADRNLYPNHSRPGIVAREWTKMAEVELDSYKWKWRIENALKLAAQKSGHGG